MSGRGAAAGQRRARALSSFLLPPSLFELEPPLFTGSLSFSFSFSDAGSRLVPPFMTPGPLRATSNCLDSSPSTGRDHLPELSELAGTRDRAGARVIEVPVSERGLEEMKVPSMWLDLVTWTVV